VEHESGNTPQYRMKENEMATTSMSAIASAATSVVAAKSTPAHSVLRALASQEVRQFSCLSY
jgi:hypothetical protein